MTTTKMLLSVLCCLLPYTACALKSNTLTHAGRTDEIFNAERTTPYELGFQAYVWGMPIVNWTKVRLYQTRPDDPWHDRGQSAPGGPINHFGLARQLSGPDNHDGVGLNNDTLYEVANFDTDTGPFVITTPNFGDRYYTFTVYMGDTDVLSSPGRRTHGAQLPPLFLYGPTYEGDIPDDMLALPADTRYVLIAGRILTDGTPDDLEAVHQLQDQINVYTLADYRAGVKKAIPLSQQRGFVNHHNRDDPALNFLAQLGDCLLDWHIREEDKPILDRLKAIGLSPQSGFVTESLSADTLAQIRRGVRDAMAFVDERSKQLGTQHEGWTTNYSGANFQQDHLLRAVVAKDQIGITLTQEAIYPIARVDKQGEALRGENHYRIVIPANEQPPVDGFWSITLYDDDGFMVKNPINRYSIGDRTSQLRRNEQGDVIIALQATRPADNNVNWLPTPEQGPFYLMMRLYIPQQGIIDKTWQPPGLQRVNP